MGYKVHSLLCKYSSYKASLSCQLFNRTAVAQTVCVCVCVMVKVCMCETRRWGEHGARTCTAAGRVTIPPLSPVLNDFLTRGRGQGATFTNKTNHRRSQRSCTRRKRQKKKRRLVVRCSTKKYTIRFMMTSCWVSLSSTRKL